MIPKGAEGATSAGGGISTSAGSATITDSVVNGNQANGALLGEGGGIYSYDSTSPGFTISACWRFPPPPESPISGR